jgi:hypothetical protein
MGKSLTGSKSELARLQKERDSLLRDSQRDRSKESQSTQNLLDVRFWLLFSRESTLK